MRFKAANIGATGFEPATSCTPSKRASQAAPRPESSKDIVVDSLHGPPRQGELGFPKCLRRHHLPKRKVAQGRPKFAREGRRGDDGFKTFRRFHGIFSGNTADSLETVDEIQGISNDWVQTLNHLWNMASSVEQPPNHRRSKKAAWKMAGGLLLVLLVLVLLAVSGVTALGKWGYLTWLGWVNLVAVFASSLALAWALRGRRTGLSLPESPPTHLEGVEIPLWQNLRQWTRSIRPDALANAEERDKQLNRLEAILYPPDAPSGAPTWKDLTLTECAAAIRLTQIRLDSDARRLAGAILDIPLGDWKQGWKALSWYWRLAPLAWLPGILLAPWEAIARWTLTRVGPEQINQGVTGRVRDDIGRHLLMVMNESLIELRSRRLRAGAELWLATHPAPPEKKRLVKGGFPWISMFLAGVLAVIPWLTICLMGVWYLGLTHPIWLFLELTCLVAGAGLAGFHLRDLWPGAPQQPMDGIDQRLALGLTAGEEWVQRRANAGTLPVADANAWLECLVELDATIRRAVGHTDSPGWDHLTPREILNWAHDQARGLDQVLRDRVPGSMHLRLGDWMRAVEWAGSPGQSPPDQPENTPTPTGLGAIWRNIKDRVGGVVESIKRRVENLAGATIARHASEGLASLHARIYLNRPQQTESMVGDPVLSRAEKPATIILVGREETDLVWLEKQLDPLLKRQGGSFSWVKCPLTGVDAAHRKTRLHQAALACSQADLAILALPLPPSDDSTEGDFFREWAGLNGNSPELTPTEVTLVLPRVNRLAPQWDWASSYDWQKGAHPVEQSIRNAIDQALAELGRAAPSGFSGQREQVYPVARVGDSAWNLEILAKCLSDKANRARTRAWNRWISDAGKPGWRHLARQAKDAGKWLWKRL